MKIKKPMETRIFEIIAYSLLSIAAVVCVLPFILIVSGSFEDSTVIVNEGYSLFIREFTTEAYRIIFEGADQLIRAYGVTIYCTVVGTVLGLFTTCLTGFVLSRREFRYKNMIAFLIYFTSIFGGGLAPFYFIYTNVLHLKGTLTALWFPMLTGPFYIFLMRTFIKGAMPEDVIEAARIDGAGHWTIFYKIILPVLKPALATVGLFLALGHWNDWYHSSLFSTDSSTWQLQYYLYNMIAKADAAKDIAAKTGIVINNLPTASMKMAMTIVVTGPILLLYPFVQKYFVQGITVGAVKG